MNEKELQKGVWKRTFHIFTNIRLPFHLYLLQIILGIISAKLSLMYVPYYTQMQTGRIDDPHIVAMYVLFMLLSMTISLVVSIPSFYADAVVSRQLKDRLISKILHLPMRRFEQEKPAVLITRVTQDQGYAGILLNAVCTFVISFVTTVMTFLQMNTLDNFLSFIVIPIILYVIFGAWLDGKLTFLGNRRQRKAMAFTTAFFAEHTAFLLNIKQMNGKAKEERMGNLAIDEMYRADVYYAILRFFTILVSGTTSKIITILVFVFGAPLVRNGTMTIEALVAFYNLVLIAYSNLSILPNLYQNFMQANGTLFYVGNLMESEEETITREQGMDRKDENLILEDVSFSYEEERDVLKHVSLQIPKGKTTAIVGQNGCGKSTVFKLLERFYEPDSGTVSFGTTNVKKIHLNEWRQSIGYVLQRPLLFNASIRENICYGLDRPVDEEELIAAAKMACAYAFIQDLPGGFDFEIGDNGSRLSEGQKQRIAIARTIMLDPSYLMLDEATSNMDVYSREEVQKGLWNLMRGRTTIFISHDPEMIARADHIIVLRDGTVEAQGAKDEVMRISETYQKIMQADGGAQ